MRNAPRHHRHALVHVDRDGHDCLGVARVEGPHRMPSFDARVPLANGPVKVHTEEPLPGVKCAAEQR